MLAGGNFKAFQKLTKIDKKGTSPWSQLHGDSLEMSHCQILCHGQI